MASTVASEKLQTGQGYDYDNKTGDHYYDVSKTSSREDNVDPILAEYDNAAQKRIVHKIDIRLVPIAGLMYCVSLLDRTNLANAAIAG